MKSAKQKFDNRNKIVAAFEDLPEIIRTIDVACKVLRKDEEENLAEFAKSLYDQLFNDIPELINLLHGKATSKLTCSSKNYTFILTGWYQWGKGFGIASRWVFQRRSELMLSWKESRDLQHQLRLA